MKFKGDENILYRDDNGLDFSRKQRTWQQRLVSKKYDRFAPDDLSVETDEWDGNPSVQKEWPNVSDEFKHRVNSKNFKLNKGGRKPRRYRFLDEELEIAEGYGRYGR